MTLPVIFEILISLDTTFRGPYFFIYLLVHIWAGPAGPDGNGG